MDLATDLATDLPRHVRRNCQIRRPSRRVGVNIDHEQPDEHYQISFLGSIELVKSGGRGAWRDGGPRHPQASPKMVHSMHRQAQDGSFYAQIGPRQVILCTDRPKMIHSMLRQAQVGSVYAQISPRWVILCTDRPKMIHSMHRQAQVGSFYAQIGPR